MPSTIRQVLHAALASQDEVAADEERTEASRQHGCRAVADLPNRRRVQVSGVLRSVVLRPREGVPTVEVELYDGSGALDLVWLGRRRIAGVEPGRRARVEGFVCDVDGRRTMFNPRYELLPRPGE
ncbi:OB-fold nucleic acid binding domain-containing protein [Cellulosimicrobium arenosum]|uniref:OB-fold nucleic acid binding domain-containing protein n=1 Tax=Cellulosimicrobium arenosum TaxID=2708133 RepID=A0A927G6X6_9MICO|nr:OB-fold nucleic acid binding domain-containing protein [Cellulosimicrobium arenosum]MBD8077972.1 OB-fold nucleic acid binding domain-containing protein [Cellulosimicrobium arenosum]